MTKSGTTVRRTAAAAALLVGFASSTAMPGGGAPAGPGRVAAGPVASRVLVDLRASLPYGVDVGGDGTVYAVEPDTGRALAQHPDGSSEVLPFTGLQAPKAIAVAADGTVYVGDGSHLRSLAPDGTQDELPFGVVDVTALAVDPADGSLLVGDTGLPQVLRVTPDGVAHAIALAGTTAFVGVAAGEAGDVLVVDTAAADVAILHPDDTRDLAGFTGLDRPASVAFHDGTTSVAHVGGVVQLDGAAVQSTIAAPIEVAGGIAAADDGSLVVAQRPDFQCRCPEGPGSVLHLDGSTTTEVTFGDVAAISSVAATRPDTVVFASTQGPPGYSDANPLRQVVGDGPATDIDTGGADAYLVAGAPDGTLYLSSGPDLARVAPDGARTAIALPTEPGQDQVVGLTVDDAGRLFVALGSGYGSGAFQVVEVRGDRTEVRFRSAADDQLQALGAGGGTLQLVLRRGGGTSEQLVEVEDDGNLTARHELGGSPVDSLTVDAAGVAYLVTLDEDPARILVVPASGEATTLRYVGERSPRHVAMGRDGTLYVDDAEVGLLALPGVGAAGAAPAAPAAPPAVPVAGAADYTG